MESEWRTHCVSEKTRRDFLQTLLLHRERYGNWPEANQHADYLKGHYERSGTSYRTVILFSHLRGDIEVYEEHPTLTQRFLALVGKLRRNVDSEDNNPKPRKRIRPTGNGFARAA